MFQYKTFAQLSNVELFAIYRARTAVFVVEQHCAYQDVDDNDLIANHLFQLQDQQITAYCRLIPQADGVHIGRVLVAQNARGKGLAQALMRQALQHYQQQWQGQAVYVQAQAYLQDFYQSFGFQPISDIYLEDDIPHLDMRLG